MAEHQHLIERVEDKPKKDSKAKIAEALEIIKAEAGNLPFQAAMDICSAVMDIHIAITQKEPTD